MKNQAGQQVGSYNPNYGQAHVYKAQAQKGSGIVSNLICLLVIAVAIGAGVGFYVTQYGKKGDNGGKSNKSNRLEGLVIPNCTTGTALDFGNTYINLFFAECPDDASYEAFVKAAFQWSSIILDNPFESSPALFPSGLNAQDCGLNKSVDFPGSFQYDRLYIVAETIGIDGVGSVLGQAGPCLTASNRPILGTMQFDSADLDSMNDDGILEDVILHEMGHVLGLGTLWTTLGLLDDPVFSNGGTVSTPTNKPKFTGAQGIAELKVLTGDTNTFIPVEDGRDSNGQLFFDTPNFQGQGSVDGHWKITDFGTELMVFAIDSSVEVHPFSKMTIASLKDHGYDMDVSLGDEYSLPSTSGLRGAAFSASGLTAKQLKTNVAAKTGLYVLDGDINPVWQKHIIDVNDKPETVRRALEERDKDKVRRDLARKELLENL